MKKIFDFPYDHYNLFQNINTGKYYIAEKPFNEIYYTLWKQHGSKMNLTVPDNEIVKASEMTFNKEMNLWKTIPGSEVELKIKELKSILLVLSDVS